jgi:MoxR-like ATPase
MPGKLEEAYARAEAILDSVWAGLEAEAIPDVDNELAENAESLVEEGTVAQRYAIITQLLRALAFPGSDPLDLGRIEGEPKSLSSRSLAKRVVVPFDSRLGAPLGGSRDPYVSQPLRRDSLGSDMGAGTGGPLWEKLLDVLDAVKADPELAESLLAAALSAVQNRKQDLAGLFRRVLELQKTDDDEGRRERKRLLEAVAPLLLKELLPDSRFQVDGGGGFGSPAEVPWIRVADPAYSQSAREGWYVAYLFAADGSAVFLCLTQGVTASSVSDTEKSAKEVRERLGEEEGFRREIDLHAKPGGKGSLYMRATALAKPYQADDVPSVSILKEDLLRMLSLLDRVEEEDEEDEPLELAPIEELTSEDVQAGLEEAKIEFDRDLIDTAVAAIRAGKHILLTGPPGTAKTSFAVILAEAAAAAGVCSDYDVITATADWTSAETIGAYWPDPSGKALKFEPGPVLKAIEKRAWLIIDELNRADIDKAFGPLFTVLSGHPARLALHKEVEGSLLPVEILPPGAQTASDTAPYEVADQWRLVATLNTRDRDLLFNLSYALLRRFAVIEVPAPEGQALLAILGARAGTGDEELDERLVALGDLPERTLGPAILIDCGEFLRERRGIASESQVDPDAFLAAAIRAFVLPQLDDLSRPQQGTVSRYLRSHVLKGWDHRAVAELLAPTFQVSVGELVLLANAEAEGAADSDEDDDGSPI